MPKQKKEESEAVSWAPKDQEAGGGLLSDVDVDFTKVDCEEWDYNGKIQGNVPALHITMTDAEGEEHEAYWSCGDLEKIVPSEDGSTFVPAEGSATKGIPASSNGGRLMRSLGDAGFPFNNDEGLPYDYDPRNIRQMLQGGNYHILRVPQDKRPGIAEPEAKAGKRAFPKEVVIVTKVNRLPWDKKGKAAGKVAGKITPKVGKGKPVEEDEDEDATTAAVEVITELLSSKKYAKSGINVEDDLFTIVFAAIKQRPDRKAIVAAIQEPDFLERSEFSVDDQGVLTLSE